MCSHMVSRLGMEGLLVLALELGEVPPFKEVLAAVDGRPVWSIFIFHSRVKLV